MLSLETLPLIGTSTISQACQEYDELFHVLEKALDENRVKDAKKIVSSEIPAFDKKYRDVKNEVQQTLDTGGYMYSHARRSEVERKYKKAVGVGIRGPTARAIFKILALLLSFALVSALTVLAVYIAIPGTEQPIRTAFGLKTSAAAPSPTALALQPANAVNAAASQSTSALEATNLQSAGPTLFHR
eukprot:GEMP01069549.1.p1 GENE.GEMP01069549.1~~GEMP01069549.1.p1  ORF type:complete len:187 (+),score=47.42 GEMP01069549.1:44-604(+)